MNLWLDDIRTAPKGWLWVKSYDQAVTAFLTHDVQNASLDHDLGYYDPADPDRNDNQLDSPAHYPAWLFQYDKTMKTGADVVRWMVENNQWPLESCAIHSANPDGAEIMCGLVNRFGGYQNQETFRNGHRYTYGVKYYGKS